MRWPWQKRPDPVSDEIRKALAVIDWREYARAVQEATTWEEIQAARHEFDVKRGWAGD